LSSERKKESEKRHILSPHTDVRGSISTEPGMMVEEVCAIISHLILSDTINSLAALWKCHTKIIIIFVVYRPKASQFGKIV